MGTSISSIAEHAEEALRAAGYMESTVGQYRKIFRYLEESSPDGMWSDGVGEAFVAATRPDGRPFEHNYQLSRERVVSLCADFAETGRFDLSMRANRPRMPEPSHDGLCASLADYMRANEARGLAAGTRDYYARLAREYLLHLERIGVDDADDATPASVASFMADIAARWPNTSTYHLASNFRPFLRFLGRDDLAEALALTRPRREHRIIETLADGQADDVAGACVGGAVAPMDAAITLLALTTGMRACDIVALRVSDLDFRTSSISFVQRKTGNPVTVPMCAALAEALGRYLLEGRPDTDAPNVFVRQKAPHAPLADHSAVYEATRRALSSAGVDGGGSLLLRHSAASRMVSAGVGLPVVSAVLGHSEPDSTNTYIETDREGMRSCVLPLPKGAVA